MNAKQTTKPAAMSAKPAAPADCKVQVLTIRVSNFRSLRLAEMHMNRLTVLVGGNNSGKTSLLEALFAALGPSRRALTEQDIYLDKDELKPPQDRTITIDVLVKPVDEAWQVPPR